MSYCKFCIYTQPVNFKFIIWHKLHVFVNLIHALSKLFALKAKLLASADRKAVVESVTPRERRTLTKIGCAPSPRRLLLLTLTKIGYRERDRERERERERETLFQVFFQQRNVKFCYRFIGIQFERLQRILDVLQQDINFSRNFPVHLSFIIWKVGQDKKFEVHHEQLILSLQSGS